MSVPRAGFLAVTLFLAGCGPTMIWTHPDRVPRTQFLTDRAQCQALGASLGFRPPIYAPSGPGLAQSSQALMNLSGQFADQAAQAQLTETCLEGRGYVLKPKPAD